MKNMIWFAALSVLTGGMIHLSVMGNGTQVFPRSCMVLAGLRMHENFKNGIWCIPTETAYFRGSGTLAASFNLKTAVELPALCGKIN